MTWFRLKACPKCQGDLASDEGYWLCLQCGTYYYTGLYNGSEPNWACRPVSGPEAGGQPNGLLTSPNQAGRMERSGLSAAAPGKISSLVAGSDTGYGRPIPHTCRSSNFPS